MQRKYHTNKIQSKSQPWVKKENEIKTCQDQEMMRAHSITKEINLSVSLNLSCNSMTIIKYKSIKTCLKKNININNLKKGNP
jgi:hypothetical protein